MGTATRIALADLAAEYRELAGELHPAIESVLASGQFVLGPELAALEAEIAGYLGVAHAVGVASGTDALHLALRAAGIGPGDDVVTTAFSFVATAEAILHAGARPVFADIDPVTFNLDPASLARAITPATRAVIVVHLFGQAAPLAEIAALARSRRLVLIEDCAQAIGADYNGRRAGAWGDFGCLSFYPTKNLGAYGDAGMVVTNETRAAERLRMLRHHGSRSRYQHEILGWNSRLDELQAAVLRVKLRHLERFIARRREIAALYRRALEAAPVVVPSEHARGRHVYHQFTVRAGDRDALARALDAAGIATSVFYPLPIHLQPAFRDAQPGLSLPHAEQAGREVLSLPMYPQLADADAERVAAALRSALPRR